MATFAEKIFQASSGSVVFKSPDIILTHDNTASIEKTFQKMNGDKVFDPDRLMVVLDHNAPPTTASVSNSYKQIRGFIQKQGIKNFYDAGEGICHQLISNHARPGMLIVGSDSHTCTAGAFNTFAAGIDRTEAAGIWKKGETWFRVPESIKVTLTGYLRNGVYAKDLSLWIIGLLGTSGANYKSLEFHGDGVKTLTISERMTLANLASEMGAKNAVFPKDEVLSEFLGQDTKGVWADEEADYRRKIEIDLNEVYPLIAAPHSLENIKAIAELVGEEVHQGLIGTCTNGRIEDLREAADILKGKKVTPGFQLHIIPASKAVYLQAIEEGLISVFLESGANVLSASCGPCLGTGQGIPPDGTRVISTANRNFCGRMGNKNAEVFLGSPASVSYAAIYGKITDPRPITGTERFPYTSKVPPVIQIPDGENRKYDNVWDYSDIDNLNTDLMFAGHLTYKILSSDPESIKEHLFNDFDKQFSRNLSKGDIIIAGNNFGCGSSREHPAVGLSYAGVLAVIVKSVNRIFFRAAINQGLPLIVLPEVVEAYSAGDVVNIDMENGVIQINESVLKFEPLPAKLLEILNRKGLVNYLSD